MPFIAIPVELPAYLSSVRAGDVDGDGIDELVLISSIHETSGPDSTRITVVDLDAQGKPTDRHELSLGRVARLLDIDGALLAVDGEGAARLYPNPRRLVYAVTRIAGLGPTQPAWVDVAHDMDGDGKPELLLPVGDQLCAQGGSELGCVKMESEGRLESSVQAGGMRLSSGTNQRPYVVGDVDGDGRQDLLFPREDRALAWLTDDHLGARRVDLALGVDLEPRPDPTAPRDAARKELATTWWRDVDADGRLDLLTQHWVVDGSWFGATAELTLRRGTGTGFTPPQVIRTAAAAVRVDLVDFDGDGDLDLLAPQVDFGLGNIARALVSRTIKVDLLLYEMRDGRFIEPPLALSRFSVPVEDPGRHQVELSADLTGDGRMDLVTNDGGDQVRVYAAGADGRFGEDPLAELGIPMPPGEDPLLVHDLTGDGRAEVFVWGPGQAQGMLLRLELP